MYRIKKNRLNNNYEAFSGNKLIGEISIDIWNFKKSVNWKDFYNNKKSSNDGTELYIKNLYVDPEYRNKGIATNLMKLALQEAVEKGLTSALLYVESIQKPAIRLYKKIGFKITGKFNKTNRVKFNYIMRMDITHLKNGGAEIWPNLTISNGKKSTQYLPRT
jgi:ribosomal protein S18 acetylase RimI-like enzyme